MEHNGQSSTPKTSEGTRKKRYKHAARKNKVKPGQNSTLDSDESNEEPYSVHELYRAEYQARHAQNPTEEDQSEQNEDAQQNQQQQNFQPPTEEDQNNDEQNQNANKEHAEHNQQSQSQEEAQNKDKSPTVKNKKWKRKKTEELFYADRVRHKGIKLVERQCPYFKGWTQEKLRERQTIDVYGGPFGLGLIMKPLRELPSCNEQTATENAKGNDKGKDVPNPSWDDWNAHQNDDILWDEWEKAQRQSVANETNDRENVHDTEQHIQVEEQDDHGQASGEKLDLLSFVDSAKINAQNTDLFETEMKDPIKQIFLCNDFFCLRDDMQSLNIGKHIETMVVDTWAIVLNDAEKFKSDESPLRLLFTIGCVNATLDEKKTLGTTYKLFAENVDSMLIQCNRTKLDLIDMEFFPICAFDHYYLIVYHLRNWTYEIIDNIDRSKMDPKKCYSEKPKILHSHFVKYLHAKGHVGISGKVKKMKPTYLNMPWQTRNNSIDCGVFLMRHMESYKGDLKSWTTGLNVEKDGQDHQLIKLRIKYNNAILSSQLNQKKKEILRQGKELYIEAASKKLVNLVINSSQQSQEERPTNTIAAKSQNKKKVTFAKNLITPFDEVSDPPKDV
uniref:Ubiquitin-like protease family profile domain-containing protein n=1 Tax=Daucus carota subsp. sativus TaxID=79200 RepID=A0A166CRT7_DAUCS